MDITALKGASRAQLEAFFTAADANPGDITPALLEHLRSVRRDPFGYYERPDADHRTLFGTLALLGHLRVTEAHADLVALLRLPDDVLYDDLFGDYLSEELPKILLLTWDGQLQPLVDLVRNPSHAWSARMAAANVILWIALTDPDHRADAEQALINTLRMASPETATDNDFTLWTNIAYELARLLRPLSATQRATLRALYADGLEDASMASWDDIAEKLDQPPEAVAQTQETLLAFRAWGATDWLHSWWTDDEEDSTPETFTTEQLQQRLRENTAAMKRMEHLHQQTKIKQKKIKRKIQRLRSKIRQKTKKMKKR